MCLRPSLIGSGWILIEIHIFTGNTGKLNSQDVFLGIGSVLDCIFFTFFHYRLPKYTKSHVSTALWHKVMGTSVQEGRCSLNDLMYDKFHSITHSYVAVPYSSYIASKYSDSKLQYREADVLYCKHCTSSIANFRERFRHLHCVR